MERLTIVLLGCAVVVVGIVDISVILILIRAWVGQCRFHEAGFADCFIIV